MQGEHHDLVHELPEHKDAIHHLKMHNMHFARYFDEYHELTDTIENIEKNNSTISDAEITDMKLKRLALKDDMYKMIMEHS